MWRINPVTFIETMRKCSWLSNSELRQLIPDKIIRGKGPGLTGPFFYERVQDNAGGLVTSHWAYLNAMMRKYGINRPQRMAAFVANSIQETKWWSDLEEGAGSTRRYAPWYGRGFLQLTNSNGLFNAESNYALYFSFRGFSLVDATQKQLHAWKNLLSDPGYDASESAGAYWAWMNANSIADKSGVNTFRQVTLDAKSQMTPAHKIGFHENKTFRKVACTINLPSSVESDDPHLNGLIDRYCAYVVAQLVLMDLINFPTAGGVMQTNPENIISRRPKVKT